MRSVTTKWVPWSWFVLVLGWAGCGTYQHLTPEAQSVTATTVRPEGNCQSLGNLTGKGGGASGGYVSNESLIEYAVNDLRNQAVGLGATHVVYSAPTMGGHEGTTTSAMVMGEALECDVAAEPTVAEGAPPAENTVPAANPAPATNPTSETDTVSSGPGGCEYDTQCKGDRVCVDRQCVSPNAAAPAETEPTKPRETTRAP